MACCRRRSRRRTEDERDAQQEPSSPSGPHFFKIILSDTLESGKLGIPRRFLRKYGNGLPGLVLLKVPGGSTWPIELKKCNNGMVWLWKGWREFMEHYSIGHGHLIVFEYEADSIFHVVIFDKSASEIDYSLSSGRISNFEAEFLSRKRGDVIEVEGAENFTPCKISRAKSHLTISQLSRSCSSTELGGMTKQSRCGESHPELVFHGPTCPRRLTRLELANKFELEHPFFKVTMRPSYFRGKLSIPSEFVKKHIHKNKEIATLRYLDRSWPVKIIRSYQHNHVASFCAGWSAFAREPTLCVGDVCVFELIDENDTVFNISIFSSAGELKQSRCRPTCPSPPTSLELASKFESENPFFKVVMQPTHITKNMTVPRNFIKQHSMKDKRTVTLRYSDRSWPVEFRFYRSVPVGFFAAGWSVFSRETRLQVRDICMFELIGHSFSVFRVSIFRNLDLELICED